MMLPFLLAPSTASVRAGGWGMVVLYVAILALCLGANKVQAELRAGMPLLAIIGLISTLLPCPVAFVLFHLFANLKGFELAP